MIIVSALALIALGVYFFISTRSMEKDVNEDKLIFTSSYINGSWKYTE